MINAGLDEAQAGIKIARRNISNLRYADDTTLMAESEEELKILLMKVKEESEKVGLKPEHPPCVHTYEWFLRELSPLPEHQEELSFPSAHSLPDSFQLLYR